MIKKYSFWSNFKFAYGPVWREKRNYIWDMILEIVFSVAVPLFGSALSAFVIWLLGNEINVITLAVCIMSAFIVYAAANAVQTYISEKHTAHNIEIRLELFFMQVIKKSLAMPLEQAENPQVRLLFEKAKMPMCTNWTGIEGFFRYGTRLGVGILGLVTYSAIAGSVHPLILFLLLLISVISAFIDNLPQWYYNKTKERKAADMVTMRYIDKVVDDVPGGKDIRVFGLKNWIIGKYDQAIMDTRRISAKKNILAYIGSTAVTTSQAIRDIVCYLYLIYLLQRGMTVAEFTFYLGIIGNFSRWFNNVSQNIVRMRQCSTEISDMRRYLDLCTENTSEKKIPDNHFETLEIVFDHVSYQYEGADNLVLKDVSFTMKAGEHKALVGLNGAGKSTLVKLISGLYLPTSGNIYVNGINTRELNLQEYYKHQSAVFQEAFTMAYTIGENVAMAEQWDERLVWKSLKAAGIAEKIESLPNKLYTHLGKDLSNEGISLSGGEIQKLLLARAIYRNPSLILLDEPTAALDALAESEFYEIYNKTLVGTTALFISHRLASTRFCEEIILLSNGEIAEKGTHEQLMKKKGKYYELFEVQSKYYEEGKRGGELDVN